MKEKTIKILLIILITLIIGIVAVRLFAMCYCIYQAITFSI